MAKKKNKKEDTAENQNTNMLKPDGGGEADIYTINTGAANRLNYKNEPTILLDAEDNLEMLDKPVKEKFSIWKKREGAKLKDMHGKDKIKYIFAYYYQWMIVAAAVIFIVYIGCFIVYRKSFDTVINIVVLNAADSNAEEYLEEAVPEYFQFGKKDKMVLDASVIMNSSTSESEEYTSASEEESGTDNGSGSNDMMLSIKLTTMSLANAIDIIIADEENFTGFASESGIVLDVTEYLPDDLYELVEDDLIYSTNADGKEAAVAIKIPDEFAENLGLSYEPYVSICCTTKNSEAAVNFIRMIYGLEYVPSQE